MANRTLRSRFHNQGNGERRTSARERRICARVGLRHVFHIISTGEPALAVQAGYLRRSPRYQLGGCQGAAVPGEVQDLLSKRYPQAFQTPDR